MKRIILFFVAVVLLPTGTVSADLMMYEYVPGEKVTLDTETGNYWYWNLADFVNKTYDEQITAIGGISPTYGWIAGGWHMADHDEMTQLWGYPMTDLMSAFAPNVPSWDLWWGRSDHVFLPGFHYAQKIFNGTKYQLHDSCAPDDYRHVQYSAWVTTSSPVVPAPPSVVLATTGMLTGLLCMLGAKLRGRKR